MDEILFNDQILDPQESDADGELDDINKMFESEPKPLGDSLSAALSSGDARLFNADLELVVLRLVIENEDIQVDAFTRLHGDDFHGYERRKIFEICQNMFVDKQEVNKHTVQQVLPLKSVPREARANAIEFDRILRSPDTDSSLDTAISILKSLTKNRKIKSEILIKAAMMFDNNEPTESIIEHISGVVINIESGRRERRTDEVTDNVAARLLGEIKIERGMLTGLTEFDRQFGGVKPDTYYTIGAASGAGKTAFVCDMIERLCSRHADKVKILFFSMEMSEDRIIQRLISRKTGMSAQTLEASMKPLTAEQKDAIRKARAEIRKYPIDIIYAPMTVNALNLRVRKFALQNPGKRLVIFLDHIGLVIGQSDNMRVNTIMASQACKSWCVEYGASVFPLTQFTKEVESPEQQKRFCRPDMRFIMESGRIRQDSDVVLLLWRPEVYTHKMNYRGQEWLTEGRMIILNEKNRDGHAPNDIIVNCNIATNKLDDSETPI